MTSPRHRTVNGTRILVEPTGRNTYSVWLSGQQPAPETFYGLWRMGKHWTITRYQANAIGIAFGGIRVGSATSKSGAIQAAVADYQQMEVAA